MEGGLVGPLPGASADVRRYPRHERPEDGRCGVMREKRERRNSLNFGELVGPGEILLRPASVSLSGSPWTSAAFVRGRLNVGNGEMRKQNKMAQIEEKRAALAKYFFRQLPSDSAASWPRRLR